MSSLADKLKLAAQSAKTILGNAIEGKDQLVSEEVYQARMLECQGCPKYNESLGQCSECGCFVKSLKGKMAGQKCPLGKWKL